MKKHKIVVAFFKADGPNAYTYDRLLAWWTKGKFSHVELLIPKTFVDGLRPEIKEDAVETRKRCFEKRLVDNSYLKNYDYYQMTSSGTCGGVRVMTHRWTEDQWTYYEFEVTETDLHKLMDFYLLTKNCKYDWIGILGFISPFADKEDRYFCSEWVAKALIILGIEKLRELIYTLNPPKTSPNRLERKVKKAKELINVK